ncbi:class F sortase [Arthrobacter deserti]|uniref:Class F sortase n=1 Tax=Arthrobacter deserti TaxID=1742687 RepID=A0ABX1JIB5_9MICC|nr:class F sortase [Arthrobacter deserti]
MSRDQTCGRTLTLRQAALAALAAVLLLPGCADAGPGTPGAGPGTPAAASPAATAPAGTPASRAAAASAAAAGVPVRDAGLRAAPGPLPAPRFLAVEGTSIAVAVVPVGVTADQAMEIPDAFNQAGWYRHGAAPGARRGTAVIAAHVDTLTDLAPFSQLQHLRPGTSVTIERRRGAPLRYRVGEVEFMAKDAFDAAELFRRDGPHQLKLVTCGGRWLDDRRDYSDNVVVTALAE